MPLAATECTSLAARRRVDLTIGFRPRQLRTQQVAGLEANEAGRELGAATRSGRIRTRVGERRATRVAGLGRAPAKQGRKVTFPLALVLSSDEVNGCMM